MKINKFLRTLRTASAAFFLALGARSAFCQNLAGADVQAESVFSADDLKSAALDMVTLAGGEFTIGEGAQSYTARRFVAPFKINKFETSYALWHLVRTEAEKRGYVFANPGQAGSRGRRAASPTADDAFMPVTTIGWYDALVWCNALSELSGKTPCYTYNGTVLRSSEDGAACDLAVCDWNANGYRLPTEAEWEYAARFTENGLQSGALASGEFAFANSAGNGSRASLAGNGESDAERVAWFSDNANGTRVIGTAGTVFELEASPAHGTGNANGAGLFDMSGNVLEFCWDWFAGYGEQNAGEVAAGPQYGGRRVSRGGSWSPYTPFVGAGDRYSFDPNEVYNYMGFRIAAGAGED